MVSVADAVSVGFGRAGAAAGSTAGSGGGESASARGAAVASRRVLVGRPEGRRQRLGVLGATGRLLLQAPGGEIDLGCGNAMSLYRSRTGAS